MLGEIFFSLQNEKFLRLDGPSYEPCGLPFALGIRLPLIEIRRERLPVFEDFPHTRISEYSLRRYHGAKFDILSFHAQGEGRPEGRPPLIKLMALEFLE